MSSFLLKFLNRALGIIGILILGAAVFVFLLYGYFSKDLPDYQQLSEYKPPVISRVYASDGSLIGEFANERRLFTKIEDIPPLVRNAFIAAEDKNFYQHPGVDLEGVLRAMATNIIRAGEGKRLQGASTITQQVMKNFLLTNERKWQRKIKEAILALRFEKAFTKDKILELYLNEIFLGARSYGVTAAAVTYFGKPLKELSIEEAAYLAALPKAPNNYHPIKNLERASARRNYVIQRLAEDSYISQEDANQALTKPLISVLNRERPAASEASFFTEEIRRDLIKRYGETPLYNAGFAVRSTLDPRLQKAARLALQKALSQLDLSRGYRGAIKNIPYGEQKISPKEAIKNLNPPPDLHHWDVAIVTDVSAKSQASIFVKKSDEYAKILVSDVRWARPVRNGSIGSVPSKMSDILQKGDVIYVTPSDVKNSGNYYLRQIPKINGAFMVMDPHTGRVLAQQGGFSFDSSQFNRATQAVRQPGSAFKPFVYATALKAGYTPETLVNDGPLYIRVPGQAEWRPKNYDDKFLGNLPLKTGLAKSRNLMTVRVARDVGIENVAKTVKDFNVMENMQPVLAMSLGAGETTLEKMVTAYGMFANGGKKISPTYFDRVQDRDGKTVLTSQPPLCQTCLQPQDAMKEDQRQYVLDPIKDYQMITMLEGVVQNGTGRRLAALGKPIAGKTGTTNESKDVWFLGFTSHLVFGVYIGYDNPVPMGKTVTGGGTAVPIVYDFLSEALKYYKAEPFTRPPLQSAAYTREEDDRRAPDSASPAPVSKDWYDEKKFKTNRENDYYKKDHVREVEDNINSGTGGLY